MTLPKLSRFRSFLVSLFHGFEVAGFRYSLISRVVVLARALWYLAVSFPQSGVGKDCSWYAVRDPLGFPKPWFPAFWSVRMRRIAEAIPQPKRAPRYTRMPSRAALFRVIAWPAVLAIARNAHFALP
jgi:hypothetical protein